MISFFKRRKLSVLDLSYYFFMGSVPIEVVGTMYYNMWVSLSFLTGGFFVFCYFLLNNNTNFVKWPPLMSLPLIWVFIITVHYVGADSMLFIGVLTGVFNNLVFSIILYNYLVSSQNIKSGLLVMGLATVCAGGGILANQGLEILSGGRFSILDFDENNIGSILAFGSLILIMFAEERTCSAKWSFVQILLAVITLAVVVATGSRGAMLSFALALFFYLILFSKEIIRVKGLLIILFIISCSIYYFQHSQSTSERWQATLRGENKIALSDRDVIFAETIEMISDQPIWGWGLQAYQELGRRIGGGHTGTHNTYLMIFVTSGVLSGLLFMLFLFCPFTKLKEQRRNALYKQLLVLLFFVLMVFMSLDWLNRKQLWIIYSMLLAHLTHLRAVIPWDSTREDVVL